MSIVGWNREQHERAVSSGEWWTPEHQQLAERLMRELRGRKLAIRLMPPEWDEDVIQQMLVVYPERIHAWKGTNYRAWLCTILFSTAIDMLRKEFHLRAKNPPEFVALDELVEIGTDVPDSGDWQDLLLRTALHRTPNRVPNAHPRA